MAPLDDIKRINESKSYTNGSFTLSVALLSSWAFPIAPILSAKLSIYYLRVVLRILFFEFCYSEMRFAHSRKCLSESLFGHIARYAPSQTFKKDTSDSAQIPISELLEPPLRQWHFLSRGSKLFLH